MKPYNEHDPKKEQIEQMFNNIAPKYDLLNHLLSIGIDKLWRRRMISLVRNHSATKILDVATGTGDVAISMARKIERSNIIGYDLSEGMLKVAQMKIEKAKLSSQITLIQGEAEKLPFDSDSFDAVTVAFGVRNFHNLNEGVSQMARVLRSGGALYVLEFSTPKNGVWASIYRLYMHNILPAIGSLISKDKKAYKYLPESVDEFPSVEKFITMMNSVGLKNSRAISLMGGVAHIYIGEK